MSPGGVLCTGNIVLDMLVRPVDEIQWGGTRWVDAITQSLGGNGANTSAALGKLGVPVTLIGAVGDDAMGQAALARLKECAVDTSAIQTLAAGTATTVALVRSDGTRAFLHQPGVSLLLYAEAVPWNPGASTTRFHIGNPFAILHLRSAAPALLKRAKDAGLATSLDTAWDSKGEWMSVLAPCLPLVDLLFLNEDEARMLTLSTEPQQIAQRLREAGASTIVLKRGGLGCSVFDGPDRIDVPGFAVRVVDTTGAGDCFAGGFLAALQRGYSMDQAAGIANAVGALNVQSLGSTSGLRGWQETLDWMQAHIADLASGS
jgi:sugar/nucleoside kinase (ribokinase family)